MSTHWQYPMFICRFCRHVPEGAGRLLRPKRSFAILRIRCKRCRIQDHLGDLRSTLAEVRVLHDSTFDRKVIETRCPS